MNSTVIIIPVYNHPDTIDTVVAGLASYSLPLILVNDGSDLRCSKILQGLASRYDWVSLVERPINSGKGAAVKSGLKEAVSLGFSHAVQLDADGQHDSSDVAHLLALSEEHPDALISGAPDYRNVPPVRYYGRYLTHLWVWINTLSLDIEDSMCGFRVYPLKSTMDILDTSNTGDRMDFDPEILVRLCWAGVKIVQFRTPVNYPLDGISHFLGFRDNMLISWAHTRLFFGMCRRFPQLLYRKWSHNG